MLLLRLAYLGVPHELVKHSSTMINRQVIAILWYMAVYVVVTRKYWRVLQSIFACLVLVLACQLSCSRPAGWPLNTFQWLKKEWVGGCFTMMGLYVRGLQLLTCFPNLEVRKGNGLKLSMMCLWLVGGPGCTLAHPPGHVTAVVPGVGSVHGRVPAARLFE